MGKHSAIINTISLCMPLIIMGIYGLAALTSGATPLLPTSIIAVGLILLVKSKYRKIRLGNLYSFGTIGMLKHEKYEYFFGYLAIVTGFLSLALTARF